ncbi:hypothetical protein Ancab_036997 [Ancistrocladus abbreviatus]
MLVKRVWSRGGRSGAIEGENRSRESGLYLVVLECWLWLSESIWESMSLGCAIPILECVYILACGRWARKRCLYTAGYEIENFQPVPRLCRFILAVCGDDLRNPIWAPPGGYHTNPDWVILCKVYEETHGQSAPYMIYLDHENADVVLAIRGLNLRSQSDCAVLFDNKLGQTTLMAARWVFGAEHEMLKDMLKRYPMDTLTFSGHSLGAGVVASLTMVLLQNQYSLGNVERRGLDAMQLLLLDCRNSFCLCLIMHPNWMTAVSMPAHPTQRSRVPGWILQNCFDTKDNFPPRNTAALEDVFKSILCLPCLLCIMCLKDTCMVEEKILKDPRWLYAQGHLYHIVERKSCRIGRFPPLVRTAVPVDGRFEHIVLSCNTTQDHGIILIERESQKDIDLMLERDRTMEIPVNQRMERQNMLAREHSQEYKAALQRAAALDVPHSYPPSPYGTFNEVEAMEPVSISFGKA